MAGQFLGMLGYKVAIASSGLAALGIFQAVGMGKSPCDLVLLDMVMGEGLDGLDTYREIVKQFPGQKCVIMTGYTDAERAQEAARLGAGQFLPKPYTLERLAKTVRDELDRRP
jgi:DNA-binding NtrC family response regulator